MGHKKISPFFYVSFLPTHFASTQFHSKVFPVKLEQQKNPKKSLLALTTEDCASQVEEEIGSQ